jgi:hypothetical protein
MTDTPPTQPSASLAELRLRRARASIGRSFRGSITDYARTIKLGSGYIGKWAEDNLCRNCRAKGIQKCRHFEIDTARHLAGPFAAIEDRNVRMMILQKAAQTAGSLVWDLAVHWMLVHSAFMRIKIFFCDSQEKANRYCNERLMDTLKLNPDILPLLPSGGMRFDNKQAEIKLLNGKHIVVMALNDSTASSLPGDVIIIDEAWLADAGMLNKAIARVKQQGSNCKIIIVSQAGIAGCDMDLLWKSLHKRVPLTWSCPCCDGRQQFELSKLRGEDFVARLPRAQVLEILARHGCAMTFPDTLPAACIAELEAAQKELTAKLRDQYVGFKIAKSFSELHTPDEIKAACANTKIECFHCGFEIPDTKEKRWRLNDSFEQDYQLTARDGSKYTPENFTVGFWNPDPASMFVPFNGTMEKYVKAKKAKEDYQNDKQLVDFYLDNWATAFDPNLVKIIRARTQERYDVQSDWPEEWRGHRVFIVDCQQELQYFWGSLWAVSKSGKSRQLWRGTLYGFGDPREKDYKKQPATITGKQREFGVIDQYVFLDAGYMKEDLVTEAAKHGHWIKEDDGEQNWYCWTLLVGSDSPLGFSHNADGNAKIRHKVSDPFYESPQMRVDGYRVQVEIFYFSTLKTGDMFVRYRDGRGPEWQELPETEADNNPLSWTAQIHACEKVTTFSKKDGAPVEIWQPPKQTTPHHFWDIGRMFMAVLVLWGLSGDSQFEEPIEVEKLNNSISPCL